MVDVVRKMLWGFDLDAMMPDVLQHESLPACECSVRLGNQCILGDTWLPTEPSRFRVSRAGQRVQWYGPYLLALEADDDETYVWAAVDYVDVPFTVRAWRCVLGNLSSNLVSGRVGTQMADADGKLSAVLSENAPSVNGSRLNFWLTGPYVDLNCGALEFACDAVVVRVGSLIVEMIEEYLEDLVVEQVSSILESFLAGFHVVEHVMAPPPLDVASTVQADLDLLDFDGPPGAGNLQVGLAVQIHPGARGAGLPASAPGAIRLGGSVPASSWTAAPLGLWIQDDVVNQALWAIWYGGGLDLPDLRSEAAARGLEVTALAAFAHLPPVLMRGEAAGGAAIGIGDLELAVTVDRATFPGAVGSGPAQALLRASAVVEGAPGADTAAQKLTFHASGTTVLLEWQEADAPLRDALERPIEAFLSAWLPALFESLVRSVDLPVVRASPPLPDGYVLGLTTATTEWSDGATRISGSFGAVPWCGDGLVVGDEVCDDGNRISGDGCSHRCRVPEPARREGLEVRETHDQDHEEARDVGRGPGRAAAGARDRGGGQGEGGRAQRSHVQLRAPGRDPRRTAARRISRRGTPTAIGDAREGACEPHRQALGGDADLGHGRALPQLAAPERTEREESVVRPALRVAQRAVRVRGGAEAQRIRACEVVGEQLTHQRIGAACELGAWTGAVDPTGHRELAFAAAAQPQRHVQAPARLRPACRHAAGEDLELAGLAQRPDDGGRPWRSAVSVHVPEGPQVLEEAAPLAQRQRLPERGRAGAQRCENVAPVAAALGSGGQLRAQPAQEAERAARPVARIGSLGGRR